GKESIECLDGLDQALDRVDSLGAHQQQAIAGVASQLLQEVQGRVAQYLALDELRVDGDRSGEAAGPARIIAGKKRLALIAPPHALAERPRRGGNEALAIRGHVEADAVARR